jgi:hypothetical protein
MNRLGSTLAGLDCHRVLLHLETASVIRVPKRYRLEHAGQSLKQQLVHFKETGIGQAGFRRPFADTGSALISPAEDCRFPVQLRRKPFFALGLKSASREIHVTQHCARMTSFVVRNFLWRSWNTCQRRRFF